MSQLVQNSRSLVRLSRLSKALSLKPQTIELVEYVLYDSLGLIGSTTKTKDFEIRLRNMIESAEPWPKLEKILRQWWRAAPSKILAAKTVELAFLNGDNSEYSKVLDKMMGYSVHVWKEVHPAIRFQTIKRFSDAKSMEAVSDFLGKESEGVWLLPAERMLALKSLYNLKKYDVVLKYAEKYSDILFDAGQKNESLPDLDVNWVYFVLGNSASACGYTGDASRYYESILPGSRHYALAAKRLKALMAGKTHLMNSEIARHLQSLGEWEQQQRALGIYLEKIRLSRDKNSELAAVMNVILADRKFLKLEDHLSLFGFVNLCRSYVDLVDKVPNIVSIFKQNVLKVHPEEIELTIWRPDEMAHAGFCNNWLTVAYLHRYVAGGDVSEKTLFDTITQFDTSVRLQKFPVGVTKPALRDAAVEALRNCKSLPSHVMKARLAVLSICFSSDQVRTASCEDYLKYSAVPSFFFLDLIQKTAVSKGAASLASEALARLSRHFYLRNSDYISLWEMAKRADQVDAMWRVATVLQSRKSLNPQLYNSWSVSGEKRKVYPVFDLNRNAINLLAGSTSEIKIFDSLLHIGPLLWGASELVSGKSYTPLGKLDPSSENSQLVKDISELELISLPKTLPVSEINVTLSTRIPKFAKRLPEGKYAAIVSLVCDAMAYSSYGGSFKNLLQVFERINRLINSRHIAPEDKKKATKLYKSMDSRARTHWLNLGTNLKKSSSEGEERLVDFILQFSLLIYPSNYEALEAVRKMQLPLVHIHRLERFIVSPEYSHFRNKFSVTSRYKLPDHMKDIPVLSSL